MDNEKSLEEKMLEAICQAHWQSTPSDSKIAARKCTLIAMKDAYRLLVNLMEKDMNIHGAVGALHYEIEKLENTP